MLLVQFPLGPPESVLVSVGNHQVSRCITRSACTEKQNDSRVVQPDQLTLDHGHKTDQQQYD